MSDTKNDATPPDDLPPEPPKASSVLGDILARARADAEAETGRLIADLRAKEEAERQAREEEERRKRDEAKARVEEERRRRHQQIEEYEKRKREEEEAKVRAAAEAARAASPVSVAQSVAAKPPSRTPLYATLALLVVGGGGFAAWWFSVPHGEPVVFAAERKIEEGRAGAFQAAPLPFGPTLETIPGGQKPEQVVAMRTPAKWEPPAEPKVDGGSRKGGRTGPKTDGGGGLNIKIETGILGGGKGKIVK